MNYALNHKPSSILRKTLRRNGWKWKAKNVTSWETWARGTLSQSYASGKTNKQIYLLNKFAQTNRERVTQYWGPEDGLVPPLRYNSIKGKIVFTNTKKGKMAQPLFHFIRKNESKQLNQVHSQTMTWLNGAQHLYCLARVECQALTPLA